MEECDELSQRASKALRFTLEEIQSGQDLTNAQRLLYEFNDLMAIMYMLADKGLISKPLIDPDMVEQKTLKVQKYLEYSRQLGTVKNE